MPAGAAAAAAADRHRLRPVRPRGRRLAVGRRRSSGCWPTSAWTSRRSARRSPGSSGAGCSSAAAGRRRRLRAVRGGPRDPRRRVTRGSSAGAGRRRPTAGCWWCSPCPEAEREQRHRCAPSWPGWASARWRPGSGSRPGTWPTRPARCCERLGLAGYVELFRGEHLGVRRRCGQRAALVGPRRAARAGTRSSSTAHEPVRERRRRRAARTPGQAFADYVRAAHRLAPAALPRPRPAAGAAARRAGTACAPRELFAELHATAGRPGPRARPVASCIAEHGPDVRSGRAATAMPCTSTSASASQSRATPMPAIAG